jgi:two-component system sensor histidine kinase YesM
LDEGDTRRISGLWEKLSPDESITNFAGRFAASHYSPYTDTFTIVIQTKAAMKAAIRDTTVVIIIMALCLCAASTTLISFLSTRVTTPIGQLIKRIENTSFDNIKHEAASDTDNIGSPPDYHDDELARLCESYNDLLKRLNIAQCQEEQMSKLHIQAEFDALQAQMNPHFLYNVLNVISHRGVQNGDEVICKICEKLASMLRYSAGVSERVVPVREEIKYLNDYLYLLKTRYRDKLSYSINIADETLNQMIPKIVLQQIVENSITHGFAKTSGVMHISVRGFEENGLWLIEITDNGCGFMEDEIDSFEKRMEMIADSLVKGKFALDIGGMGLLNIYARFFILLRNYAVFRIGNAESDGARVIIGAAIKTG